MIRARCVQRSAHPRRGGLRIDRFSPDAAQRSLHRRQARRPARRRHAALPVGQVAQPLQRPALEAARNQQDLRLVQKTSPRATKASARSKRRSANTPTPEQ